MLNFLKKFVRNTNKADEDISAYGPSPIESMLRKNPGGGVIEDLSYARNIQEKLASLNVGQTFALATRTGMHIFKKTSIQPHENVKDKSKE